MATLSHENRAVDAFVRPYAESNALSEEAAQRLTAKLHALNEWLKTFRRAIHFAQRYPSRHPSRGEALQTVVDATRAYLREYGALTMQFGPGASRTSEGFELPHAQEEDLQRYTFYPFFRDGVVELQLKPGISPVELDTILEICASGGRREDDDVVTWIWAGRLPKVRMRVEPALSPRIAAALAVQAPEDDILLNYLTALEAAGPFWQGADGRVPFTVELAEPLAAQGIDVSRVQSALFGDAVHRCEPPTPEHHRAWREAVADLDDRRERLLGIGRARSTTGGAP
jgi:hypothetical protein